MTCPLVGVLLEKIDEWFMAIVKAQGANEQDFKDGAVADLALRMVGE
jgi:hypothetical protein